MRNELPDGTARGVAGRAVAPRIYLDHAASTSLDEAAATRMADVARASGNASSVHSAGVWATREVERARMRIADALGASPEEITFTSGATEANNFALKGVVWSGRRARPHLIVSAVEHPSISEPAAWLQAAGHARVTTLPVDSAGRVRAADVEAALGPDTVLVSVQHVNNETGVLHPVAEIGRICRAAEVLFHVDASQGFQKAPLNVAAMHIDLLTASGHKLHGPKGVGVLYAREGVSLVPLLHGGGHERGVRGGTLNAPAIAGFGEAVLRYTPADVERITGLQQHFERELRALFPNVRIHGADAPRVPMISNFAVPGQSGKALFLELDRRGILVSASSACHSTLLTPSGVLIAMGLSPAEANEALRVSFGRSTTVGDVDTLLHALTTIIKGVAPCP